MQERRLIVNRDKHRERLKQQAIPEPELPKILQSVATETHDSRVVSEWYRDGNRMVRRTTVRDLSIRHANDLDAVIERLRGFERAMDRRLSDLSWIIADIGPEFAETHHAATAHTRERYVYTVPDGRFFDEFAVREMLPPVRDGWTRTGSRQPGMGHWEIIETAPNQVLRELMQQPAPSHTQRPTEDGIETEVPCAFVEREEHFHTFLALPPYWNRQITRDVRREMWIVRDTRQPNGTRGIVTLSNGRRFYNDTMEEIDRTPPPPPPPPARQVREDGFPGDISARALRALHRRQADKKPTRWERIRAYFAPKKAPADGGIVPVTVETGDDMHALLPEPMQRYVIPDPLGDGEHRVTLHFPLGLLTGPNRLVPLIQQLPDAPAGWVRLERLIDMAPATLRVWYWKRDQ